ncbi:PH-like domain-containing protein [Kocuria sp.]|uniref:PH-like domain-containing protein n=1 Tax=Kocuria sp. TaxID=1871328 RepID=UPI0026DEF8AF|nr:ABC transporter permease [Kocuria sp.]MDO5617665.1 ABC transporter permease [Kocuria sp.]
MDEKLLTALILAVFVVVLFTLVGRAWLRRTRAAEAAGGLPVLPEDIESREPVAVVPGMYVATVAHQIHLERVMAHNLGLRTSATVFTYPDGVLFDRDGADPLWVAAQDMVGHGTTNGMVGKFVERDGIVVLSWRWNQTVVDTGLRTKTREGKADLLNALSALNAQTTEYGTATEPETATPNSIHQTRNPSTKETP